MVYSELKNKVAVVTGGSKGIGTAIAERFGKEKMKVVVNYHSDKAGAEETAKKIKENGGDATIIQADISTEEGAQQLVDAAIEKFGGLDVWVNNAGMENQVPTKDMTLSNWKKVIDVDLTGVFLGMKVALNYFTKNGKKGNIINMSSVHEQIPWPTYAHYAAAKGGVKMLTQTVAMEYAKQNIRVNAIGPGAINTHMNAEKFSDPEQKKLVLDMIPMGRIGDPKEVAAVAAWLASDESSYVTGITMFVDGGMALYPSFQGGRG